MVNIHQGLAFLLLASAAILVAESKLFGETAGSAGLLHLSSVSRQEVSGNSTKSEDNGTKKESPSPSPSPSSSSSSSSSSPSSSPSGSPADSPSADSNSPSEASQGEGRCISYAALKADSVPCNRRGPSYYNCNEHGQVNPYTRGCSCITRCARELDT